MKLMTKAIQKTIPAPKAQEGKGYDAIVYLKLFSPYSNWTWYATEYDPTTGECFGLVNGFDQEFGYFQLSELQGLDRGGVKLVERDMSFQPTPLRDIPGVDVKW